MTCTAVPAVIDDTPCDKMKTESAEADTIADAGEEAVPVKGRKRKAACGPRKGMAKKVEAEVKETKGTAKKPKVEAKETKGKGKQAKAEVKEGQGSDDMGDLKAAPADKKSWLSKLPQPGLPPAADEMDDTDGSTSGASVSTEGDAKAKASTGRARLCNDDVLCAFRHLLSNFNRWKPHSAGPGDGTARKMSRKDKSIVEEYYGENKYNYLELCVKITTRHPKGWGEYVRKPFPNLWNAIFKWIQDDSCAAGALKLNSSVDFSWKVVVESLWDIKDLRPAWGEIRKERGLASEGNEMLRKKMNSVVKTLLGELERIEGGKKKAGDAGGGQ